MVTHTDDPFTLDAHTQLHLSPPPKVMSARMVHDLCDLELTAVDIKALVPDVLDKFNRFVQIKGDPNVRECPKCSHLQVGSASQKNMTCGECTYQYCFEHGPAHEGGSCRTYERRMKKDIRETRKAVQGMGARPCPGCKADIVKTR